MPAEKKEFEHLNANTMTKGNVRVFFPVGMGGFSFERMDETTVVYDCGSTSKMVIKDNIKALKSDFFGVKDRVIDHLFISHFDEDHRNGIDELLKTFEVKEIHLPYVEYKYRAVLNFMTHNGVTQLFNTFLFQGKNCRFSFYQTNRSTAHSIRSKNGKWEWVITNLLNETYFVKALEALKGCGIDFDVHHTGDPLEEMIIVGGDLIEEIPLDNNFPDSEFLPHKVMTIYTPSVRNIRPNKKSMDLINAALPSFKLMTASDKLKNANHKVPDIVKDIEKNLGHAKNEYGMLMLSKSVADAYTAALFFKNQDLRYWWPYLYDEPWDYTSCLYTGDMCMNKEADMNTILSLISYNKKGLQFFQIPHHGSTHNSSLARLQNINTQLYFCYDSNCRRLVNNFGQTFSFRNPYNIPLNLLLIDRNSEMDEAVGIE